MTHDLSDAPVNGCGTPPGELDFSAWFALLAPTGTPVAALDALNRQVVAATQAADLRSRVAEAGFTLNGGSRVDAEHMLKTEAKRWAAIVKATGFKGD